MKKRKIHFGLLVLIMAFWFVLAFIQNILGPLVPDIIKSFDLESMKLAGFIPTSFFLAYAIISIPAGILADKIGEKKVLMIGACVNLIGVIIFGLFPTYIILLISCFIMGMGMAMIQPILNPLQRIAGGEENYAVTAQIGQFMFGTASFAGPLVYSYLVRHLTNDVNNDSSFIINFLKKITPENIPWVSLYWVFSLLLVILIVVTIFAKFNITNSNSLKIVIASKADANTDNAQKPKNDYSKLMGKPITWLFFLGIFLYVASEQGISIWISSFMEQYHGLNPQVEGAHCVSGFWGMMTIGSVVGIFLLRLLDSKLVLKINTVGAILMLALALFGPAKVAMWAFPAIGFFIAVMYSLIFSLALNSVTELHGSFAGILCTGIVGGAVGPLIISFLADSFGSLRFAMCVVFLFFAYIFSVGIWAKPLIKNKTISFRGNK
ncbi:MAG: MFS transporter [Bacteroidales bacterium]